MGMGPPATEPKRSSPISRTPVHSSRSSPTSQLLWTSCPNSPSSRVRGLTLAAAELSTLRADAAPKLERALIERLKDLAIPDASVRVVLEERELYEGGLETVTFLAALSAASGERPLGKVASGGELSRVALALHVLTADSSIPTMVFDEVDAGVGGKAAQSVGRSLAELARTGTQVFLVTHLPQVAAFADSHFRVSKRPGRAEHGCRSIRLPARIA